MSKDERIAGATTGDDELMDFSLWEDEAIQSVDDGERSEKCGGADEVVRGGAVVAADGEKFFDVVSTKIFAAGGFWWGEFEVRIAEKFIEKCGNAAAFRREMGILVETMAAVREMLDEGVNQHIGGTGVESKNL